MFLREKAVNDDIVVEEILDAQKTKASGSIQNELLERDDGEGKM